VLPRQVGRVSIHSAKKSLGESGTPHPASGHLLPHPMRRRKLFWERYPRLKPWAIVSRHSVAWRLGGSKSAFHLCPSVATSSAFGTFSPSDVEKGVISPGHSPVGSTDLVRGRWWRPRGTSISARFSTRSRCSFAGCRWPPASSHVSPPGRWSFG